MIGPVRIRTVMIISRIKSNMLMDFITYVMVYNISCHKYSFELKKYISNT